MVGDKEIVDPATLWPQCSYIVGIQFVHTIFLRGLGLVKELKQRKETAEGFQKDAVTAVQTLQKDLQTLLEDQIKSS